MLTRTNVRAAVTVALLAATVLIFTTVRWPRTAAHAEPIEAAVSAGVGETLLLVVADVGPAEQVAAVRDALNARFGHLQGFYLDGTDGYRVKQILEPAAATVTRVACARDGSASSVDETSVDCPDDAARVDVLRPIRLRVSDDGAAQRQPFDDVLTDSRFPRGRTLVTTAFRTKAGAEQFLEFARAFGVTDLATVQVLKLFGGEIGLGQEPHPNGSGPLLGPLPDQERFQR